jgi:hypothetical protein
VKLAWESATRQQAKARIAIAGPSGSGKSYTAFMLAQALCGPAPWGVVDTERESSNKYAATSAGTGGFTFQRICPVRFDPRHLVDIIDDAADGGLDALVVDSLSHYWFGPGGILELVDRATAANRGRSMDGWKEIRPIERAYVEALCGFPGHVIVTLRTKTRYEIEDGDDGKKRVTKLGTTPEQRDGLEYEFDVFADMDLDHNFVVSKTRCSTLDGAAVHKPGPELAHTISAWLAEGEAPKYVDWPARIAAATNRDQLQEINARAIRAGAGRLVRDALNDRWRELGERPAVSAMDPDDPEEATS